MTTPIRVSASIMIEEREVAEALALGDGDGEVAEHGRDADQAQDREDAAERAADEDQQDQGPDGVGRDPLRGEREPQQDADDRHRQPERGAAAPPTRPDRREDGVGRDDEQAHVDVVHADPGLDEEHPVHEHEEPDEAGHEPALEEDPGQEEQQARGEGAGDDPGNRQANGVRPDVDGGGRPARA